MKDGTLIVPIDTYHLIYLFFLYGLEVLPPNARGETEFSNMLYAYDN